jgi:lathosterol oxidase
MNDLSELALRLLRGLPLPQAALLLLAENLAIFVGSVLLGAWLVRRFGERRVAPPPPPTEPMEILCTVSTILINTAVTLAGLLLWRAGLVSFRGDLGPLVLLDVLVLLLVMDAAMYGMHRAAHIALVYPFVHRTHHRYDRPHPLSLFVLNPFEALGFGGLWLLVISLYQASWLGMAIYLGLNVLFGTIGHLGVEPFPDAWRRLPLLRWLATSTFHAQHHQLPGFNFGFYTLLWDRAFGTLTPQYDTAFGRIPAREVAPAAQTGEPGSTR